MSVENVEKDAMECHAVDDHSKVVVLLGASVSEISFLI